MTLRTREKTSTHKKSNFYKRKDQQYQILLTFVLDDDQCASKIVEMIMNIIKFTQPFRSGRIWHMVNFFQPLRSGRIWHKVNFFPNSPLGQDMTQGQFLSGV